MAKGAYSRFSEEELPLLEELLIKVAEGDAQREYGDLNSCCFCGTQSYGSGYSGEHEDACIVVIARQIVFSSGIKSFIEMESILGRNPLEAHRRES